MAKPKECMRIIPNIYKKNYVDLGMFFYVMGICQLVPTVTTKAAIERYMAFINVDEDTFNLESALANFTLMKKEFFDVEK